MKNRVALILMLIAIPLILGCPGNRRLDKECNDKLTAWIQEQDTNGWHITGFETNYTNIVVTYEFRPTKLDIAIKGDSVNPLHQRNLMDDLARKWWGEYPANLRPRFNLRVTMYDLEINGDNELGWSEIDQDGTVETHHMKTGDVM